MKKALKLSMIMVSMIFLFSSLIPTTAYAQKITFKNCRLELNAKDKKGKNMTRFHFTAEGTNLKKHDFDIYMCIESPKGTPHTYTDGDTGGEGLLRYSVQKTKHYKNGKHDSHTYKDKSISIYTSDIHPKKGKHTYYVYIEAVDCNTYKTIGRSDYLSFTMTGK